MIEIRFHGRGGQGAVTSSDLLAKAVAYEGKFSQAFPFFGVERRGAPVTSFCRIDHERIRLHQQVYSPDIVVVLDAGLSQSVDICSGLKPDGKIVINTKELSAQCRAKIPVKSIFVVDASSAASEAIGSPIVSAAILGALARATGIVGLDSVKRAIDESFPQAIADKNKLAAQLAYERLVL
jgi:pyruvate ferredoxin oxidoreductase gamma subunit/2-oxoisovalerate ferredoxin oxidoreductase gamma subunit